MESKMTLQAPPCLRGVWKLRVTWLLPCSLKLTVPYWVASGQAGLASLTALEPQLQAGVLP